MTWAATWAHDADGLPPDPGAYALRIVLDRPHAVFVRRVATALPAGIYVYVGSARGPGGVRARCRRHLRPDKATKWHVDQLTNRAAALGVRAYVGGHECDLMRRLLAQPGVSVPIPGFGSADCRACPAHLAAVDAAGLDAALGE